MDREKQIHTAHAEGLKTSLYDRLQYGPELTDAEIDSLVELLGHRCHERTKHRLASCLKYSSGVSLVGILGRVELHKSKASYCAGQSYPDEIRTVRNHIIGRR